MHSRKNVIILWAMLLCAVFMTGGCKKDTGEENALVSVEQTESPIDIEGGEDEESAIPKDEERKRTLDQSNADSEVEESAADIPEGKNSGGIYVDVCGHVKNPGVYQLTEESRVFEAIEKAGGMTKNAAAASVNQAERLTDGQQIYIPSEDEQKESRESGTYPAVRGADEGNMKTGAADSLMDNGKVNLNTASKEELLSLTGIGDVKADAIVKYREEHGSFQSVEDLKKIEGIKDGVFNKIKDRITV